jgi:hypothetical protein
VRSTGNSGRLDEAEQEELSNTNEKAAIYAFSLQGTEWEHSSRGTRSCQDESYSVSLADDMSGGVSR